MPIALKPGKKLPIVLTSDAGQENPPTFYTTALSAEDAMDFAEKFDSLAALSGKEAIKTLCDAISSILLGWENMRTAHVKILTAFGLKDTGEEQLLPFRPELLSRVVSLTEAKEIMSACIAGRLLDEDTKKSESPSDSKTA